MSQESTELGKNLSNHSSRRNSRRTSQRSNKPSGSEFSTDIPAAPGDNPISFLNSTSLTTNSPSHQGYFPIPTEGEYQLPGPGDVNPVFLPLPSYDPYANNDAHPPRTAPQEEHEVIQLGSQDPNVDADPLAALVYHHVSKAFKAERYRFSWANIIETLFSIDFLTDAVSLGAGAANLVFYFGPANHFGHGEGRLIRVPSFWITTTLITNLIVAYYANSQAFKYYIDRLPTAIKKQIITNYEQDWWKRTAEGILRFVLASGASVGAGLPLTLASDEKPGIKYGLILPTTALTNMFSINNIMISHGQYLWDTLTRSQQNQNARDLRAAFTYYIEAITYEIIKSGHIPEILKNKNGKDLLAGFAQLKRQYNIPTYQSLSMLQFIFGRLFPGLSGCVSALGLAEYLATAYQKTHSIPITATSGAPFAYTSLAFSWSAGITVFNILTCNGKKSLDLQVKPLLAVLVRIFAFTCAAFSGGTIADFVERDELFNGDGPLIGYKAFAIYFVAFGAALFNTVAANYLVAEMVEQWILHFGSDNNKRELVAFGIAMRDLLKDFNGKMTRDKLAASGLALNPDDRIALFAHGGCKDNVDNKLKSLLGNPVHDNHEASNLRKFSARTMALLREQVPTMSSESTRLLDKKDARTVRTELYGTLQLPPEETPSMWQSFKNSLPSVSSWSNFTNFFRNRNQPPYFDVVDSDSKVSVEKEENSLILDP